MPSPHEIADSLEPELREAFLAIVDAVRLSAPLAQVEALLDASDIVGLVNLFEEAVAAHLVATPELISTYGALVSQPLAQTLRGAGLSGSFNIISGLVLDNIQREAASLIVGIGQDTIAAVRTIVEQEYLTGIGARAAGRIIRSVVGLLPSHANAVGKYAATLARGNVPEEAATHFVEQYATRLRNYRAENIARTETIRASVAGQVEGWTQLANQGILQRHRTRMVWMVTEDDRLCPYCAPMDGVTVELGQLFMATHKGFPDGKPDIETPGSRRMRRGPIRPDPRSQPRDAGGRFLPYFKADYLDGSVVELKRPLIVPHPPLHPQCRCALILKFID